MKKLAENKILQKIKPIVLRVTAVCARSGLLEVMLVASLVLSRYYANIDFSYPSEIVPVLVLLGGLAFAVFYVFRLFLGVFAAHIAALLVSYGLYSFQYSAPRFMTVARALLPQRLETTFTTSVVTVVFMMFVAGLLGWGLAWFLRRKWFNAFQPSKILVFFVLFMFASAGIRVGLRLIEIRHELAYQHKAAIPAKKADTTARPDIYYIVLDRYGNSTTLQKQYNYDNGQFLGFLSGQGFVTRNDAYANYPFTMSSITSTLAMQYHTELGAKFGSNDFQTAFPYRSIFNDPPVAQALRNEGYTYNQVSSWWDFTRVGIQSDTHPTESFRLTVFGHAIFLSDLSRDIVNKSILSPWLKKGLTVSNKTIIGYDRDDNPYQNFENQMNTLKRIASTKHDKPQFTFAHVLSPHDPYIFNKDGTAPSYDGGRNDSGVDETVKYTNQLTYLNSRIQDVVATIRAQSPDAAIIIQADEGPYPKQFRFELTPNHYYNPVDLELPQMQQKFGVLASYYMPGVSQQEVAANITSSVNSLRFVLAHYLGYDTPPLPDCQFATGDKFMVYGYKLVTEQLTGRAADSRCAALAK